MKRVAVAMSGGVDSSTAAAMLVELGYEVVGLAMRLYDAGGTVSAVGGRCCGPRDLQDARRVAADLGFPLYVLNYEDRFREAVIDDFVAEYVAGRTPSPCVRCNQRVKFGSLIARAKALGAEFLATGHYARIGRTRGKLTLRRSRDTAKDQSYFLFALDQQSLSFLHFPLGELTKSEVREVARRAGLHVADKPESMEICFVPDGDHVGFIQKRAGRRPGQIVDERGAVIGRHDGIERFTVGQRRGLGGGGARRFVARIEAATGRVVVGPRNQACRSKLRVHDVYWMEHPPVHPVDVLVQVRHRGRPVQASVRIGEGMAEVELAQNDVVAASGQAAVFYEGDRVMGGGWIE